MTYFLSLFVATFILEDVALLSGIALMAENKISFSNAFWACFLGISIGDLGLYFLGRLATSEHWESRFPILQKYRIKFSALVSKKWLSYSIVISRVIPGTRIPTYFCAGYLKYSVWRFLFLTGLSVFTWVWLALWGGDSLNSFFSANWVNTLVLIFISMYLVKASVPLLSNKWRRKAFFHSWRRWTRFEFWPALFFYVPIIYYYIYLSIKYRSFLVPFYANPHIKNGGLIGESKWDFLSSSLDSEPSTLKAVLIPKSFALESALELVRAKSFEFPMIIKPDVGQRGFGVRIIKNETKLSDYIRLSDFDRIVQKLSDFANEAGLFYIRMPDQENGIIFSITNKKFPYVIGDGKCSVGDLILNDKRARIIAPVYFSRLESELDRIPSAGESIYLSECGNHCQGAIFLNGNQMITPELTKVIDRLAKQLPDFYFGRFDVRYESVESLMRGEGFQIVEINGAGAEATHIWDSSTRLFEAYQTLFVQWEALFKIGQLMKLRYGKTVKIRIGFFLLDCLRVYFRTGPFNVSS